MPTEQKVTRKLIAPLSADVKGYSILLADDEVSTIQTRKDYRTLMLTCIEKHGEKVLDDVFKNMKKIDEVLQRTSKRMGMAKADLQNFFPRGEQKSYVAQD